MKTSNALVMIADAIFTLADESEEMSNSERTALSAFSNQLRDVAADLDQQEKTVRDHLLVAQPVASPLYKEK